MKTAKVARRATFLLYQRGARRAFALRYVLVMSEPMPKRPGITPYSTMESTSVKVVTIAANGNSVLAVDPENISNDLECFFPAICLEMEGSTLKLT